MIVGIDARIPIATGRGWGRYTRELISALARRSNVQLRVFLPTAARREPWVQQLCERDSVEVACVDFDAASPDEFEGGADNLTIESRFPDIDLVHSPTRFVLPTDFRPIVATVHDIAPLSNPPFKLQYHDATKRALAFIQRERVSVVTVSAFTRQELATRAGLDIRDVEVIHHGVSSVFSPGPAPQPAESPYVLYVGGAGANKNLDRLLSAMARLRRSTAIDLLMAGDRSWDHEELRQALGSTMLPWVRLCGYVGDEALAMLYRNAALCVMPSLHEGFGLPVLEAMACGTPVACSSITVFEEVAGDAAVYFDPFDAEDMAAAMRSILVGPTRARASSARGLVRARAFTWSETARKTIAVYQRSLRRERTTASPR